MRSNDRIVLQELLRQMKHDVAPESDDDRYFELFVGEQVLKNHDLSYEELESGLVRNPQDGGIDGAYVFIDDTLLSEDLDLSVYKRGVEVELVVIQSKTSPSFAEAPLDKFRYFAEDLLDLSHSLDGYRNSYCSKLLAIAERFRSAWIVLAKKFPRLAVRFVYASQGQTNTVNDRLRTRAKAIERVVKSSRQ